MVTQNYSHTWKFTFDPKENKNSEKITEHHQKSAFFYKALVKGRQKKLFLIEVESKQSKDIRSRIKKRQHDEFWDLIVFVAFQNPVVLPTVP